MPPRFGGAPSCPTCGKSVYFAEQTLGPGGGAFHKLCLKCVDCAKILEPRLMVDNAGLAYCKPCHSKSFGAKGYGAGGALVGEYAPRSSPTRPAPSPSNASPVRAAPPPKPSFDDDDTRDSRFTPGPPKPPVATKPLLPPVPPPPVREDTRAVPPPPPVPPAASEPIVRAVRPPPAPAPAPPASDALSPPPPAQTASAPPPRPSLPSKPASLRQTVPLSPSTPPRASAGPTTSALGASPIRDLCRRCGTVVYHAEEVRAVGGKWHKRCLRCTTCCTTLAPNLVTERDGAPYCKKCYAEQWGLTGGLGVMTRPNLY
ncbi:hypothetical protein JCM10207_008627 [Rhodosporidiobolus poonsookiae]